MISPARAERLQLCDLALEVGPNASTLSGDWDVRHLMAHLVVRERQPHNAIGIVVPTLAARHDRAVEATAHRPFTELVGEVRTARTPLAFPVVDRLANSLEFFVHHEDVRRSQPGWEPRDLPPATEDALWRMVRFLGRALVRPAQVPVRIERRDSGARISLARGTNPVLLTGEVGEIVMFLYGRAQTRNLEFDGPAAHVTALKASVLGF